MTKPIKHYIPYIPLIGFGIYLIVFTIAVQPYPGGSVNIPNDIGYSFFHNFLCDAMNPITQSGAENSARPMAIVSHLILSVIMISFFYVLPDIFSYKNRNTKIIRWFGVLTMTIFIFMYTPYHDKVVTLTAIFGAIALTPYLIELRNYPIIGLKRLSIFCYILSFMVFFIFVTKIGFYYLPFIQKITFVFDAWWVIWVCLIVKRKNQKELIISSTN